jgi:hypothetical protein
MFHLGDEILLVWKKSLKLRVVGTTRTYSWSFCERDPVKRRWCYNVEHVTRFSRCIEISLFLNNPSEL